SKLLRVGSSSSKRRLVEPLLLGCGLVSRSRLRGGRPLSPATRTRPVLLGIPLLALRRRTRRGLLPLRRDPESVHSDLGPLPLLAILLIGAGRLAAHHDQRSALGDLGQLLGLRTERDKVSPRRASIAPLAGIGVLRAMVLGHAALSDSLTRRGELQLGGRDEVSDESGLCH